jgi:hypothetical protein
MDSEFLNQKLVINCTGGLAKKTKRYCIQGRKKIAGNRWRCITCPTHQAHSLLQSTCPLDHLPYFSDLHFHETEIFPWHQFHPLAQQALGPHHVACPSKPTCTKIKTLCFSCQRTVIIPWECHNNCIRKHSILISSKGNISNSKKELHIEINAYDVQGMWMPSPHVDLLFLKLQNNMSQITTAGESGLVPQNLCQIFIT